ncbi:hypothetical protein FS837_005873, partial [Tulasnella sp. UAMH 9824]
MKLDHLKSTLSAALDGIRETDQSPKTLTNYPKLSPVDFPFNVTSPQPTETQYHTPGPYVQHMPGVPPPCTWIEEYGRLSDNLSLESFFLLKNLYPNHSDNQNVLIPAAGFEFRNPFWVEHLNAAQANAVTHPAAGSDSNSAEYTCYIHGLLISRSRSDGDFRGTINVQHSRPLLIDRDVPMQSDSDEPGWSHLFTRTYNLDAESEYASNQFAFIHPTNLHHSKYALDSITPIESRFRLLLLYDIRLRPKTPIMDVSEVVPPKWIS